MESVRQKYEVETEQSWMVSKKNQNQIFEVKKENKFVCLNRMNSKLRVKKHLIGRKGSYFLDSSFSDSHSTYAIFNID